MTFGGKSNRRTIKPLSWAGELRDSVLERANLSELGEQWRQHLSPGAAILAGLTLASCLDPYYESGPAHPKLESIGQNEFKFEVSTEGRWSADRPSAERQRMRWLEDALSYRDLCPDGYVITSRTPVPAGKDVLGDDQHRIYYTGVCR